MKATNKQSRIMKSNIMKTSIMKAMLMKSLLERSRIVVLIVLLCVIAGSCIPSLFPLHTKDDIVFDDRIIGTWDADGDRWTIEKREFHPDAQFMSPSWTKADEDSDKKNVHYRLTVEEYDEGDTLEATFIMTLLELDGKLYANFRPQKYDLHHDFLSWHMIEANNFAKIDFPENKLAISYFNPEYLEGLIEDNRIRISHIYLDDFLLITAPTKELQKFVKKFVDEEHALLDMGIYDRI